MGSRSQICIAISTLLLLAPAAQARVFKASDDSTNPTFPPPPDDSVEPLIGPPSQSGEFELIGTGNVVGVQVAAIPGTDKFFFAERPTSMHPDGGHNNAGYLDLVTRAFTNVACATSLENAGHSYLADGTLMVLAGHKPQSVYPEGRRGIRRLNMTSNVLQDVGTLRYGHWLATATQLPSGHITIMSDSPNPVDPITIMAASTTGSKNQSQQGKKQAEVANPFYELWDPANPTGSRSIALTPEFLANTKYFYYPFNYVLPTGHLFVWSNTFGQIIEPLTGRVVVGRLPDWSAITKTLQTAYPFGGTSVMLPLLPERDYDPEIMVFGGQWSYGWINTTASHLALRLAINITESAANPYQFPGGWQAEAMPSPRSIADSVLLPNGMVLIINGAKRGLLGDSAAGGVAMANEPNFHPVLYDPYAPAGQRFTTMTRSMIPRLLHSTALLTTNGTVLVAGCDRCAKFWSTKEYSPSPTGFAEYRVEVFKPPAFFDTANKPIITQADPRMAYGGMSIVRFKTANASATVTSAVLVAPSSTTHTFNMHQRVVGLKLLGLDTDDNHVVGGGSGERSVVLQAPPNANIAPPGMYMLFLLSGRTYGPASWVTLG